MRTERATNAGEVSIRRVCHTVPDTVSQGLGELNLFIHAIADQVRNDINVNCHTALDAVSHGFEVEELRS